MKSKKIKIVAGLFVFLSLIIIGILFAFGYFRPLKAGLIIETNPVSTVFINNEPVGKTRLEITRESGEITLKLVPESFDQPLPPYEVRVNLVSGVKTIVQRDFAVLPETASGIIISFEKISGRESGLAVVTEPDSAQIYIDGQPKGTAPYNTANVSVGEHTLSVNSEGILSKTVKVRTYEGYKLTAVFKLAKDLNYQSPTPEPLPSPSPISEEKIMVEIVNTPTGFLRVRNEPSTIAGEVGQVVPGEQYQYVTEDEKTGWFKILLPEGGSGWVSNQYAKKVLAGASPSPESAIQLKSASPSAVSQ